jgi:SAM-dependent methyltransferase
MNHRDVGRYWNANAETWTRLARAGYDIYRDFLNTPAFFEMLPDVRGLRALDIGCGEGYNTRLLSERGARVTGVDIAGNFIAAAAALEHHHPLGIDYHIASAVELPFGRATFDAVTAFMSLMDIPEPECAIGEALRVLRPGGFLQFSILHPCFMTRRWRSVKDEHGTKVAVEVGDYFENENGAIDEWYFSSAPPEARVGTEPFRIPRFTRTMSQWLNLLIDTGFTIERVGEPYPSDDAVRQRPRLARARVVADFFHVRARKPAAG